MFSRQNQHQQPALIQLLFFQTQLMKFFDKWLKIFQSHHLCYKLLYQFQQFFLPALLSFFQFFLLIIYYCKLYQLQVNEVLKKEHEPQFKYQTIKSRNYYNLWLNNLISYYFIIQLMCHFQNYLHLVVFFLKISKYR